MLQITSNDVHTYLGSRAPPASTSSVLIYIGYMMFAVPDVLLKTKGAFFPITIGPD